MATPVLERYSQQSNPGFEAVMARRTAASEGAFLLKHLHEGMRVLDVGCGPGSITLGFANAVGTGKVVGVDFQASQVAEAEKLCAARGITNVNFEVADAYQLPFPDNSFEAVFAHAVLWHLKDPARALAEMRRVLCSGGIIGIRDCDWGGRLYAPSTPLLDQWFDLTVRIRQRNGGDPFFGRHQRRLLIDAGFSSVQASVSTWSSGTDKEIQDCATFLLAQLKGFSSTALSEGWIDQPTIEDVAREIKNWAQQPAALYVDTYCEAIGYSND